MRASAAMRTVVGSVLRTLTGRKVATMSHRRRASLAAVGGAFLVALGTSACYGYHVAELTPTPGTRVRLVLQARSPVAVAAAGADGPRTLHANILEATGTVVAASRDTIVLRLGELYAADGAVGGLGDLLALVPVDHVAQVTERHFQAGRTALGGAGLLLVATATLIVLLIVTIVKAAGG